MDKGQQAELIALLQSLPPADVADVLRFILIRKAAHFADLKPPTAAEWERLTAWQRRVIAWQFRFYLGRARAVRFIRSLAGKAER
jgi:hypothetical protein